VIHVAYDWNPPGDYSVATDVEVLPQLHTRDILRVQWIFEPLEVDVFKHAPTLGASTLL
jgi:hypothetical protein